MAQQYEIKRKVSQLSDALIKKGIKIKLERVNATKHGIITIPQAKVKLKITDSHHFGNPEEFFIELQDGGKRLHDFQKTVLVCGKNLDTNPENLIDAIAKYLFTRVEILKLISTKEN